MDPNARVRLASEISEGDEYSFEVTVHSDLVHAFAEVSGDFNPLHVDASYARSAGFRDAVAHGALQIAWVSQALGMGLIGAQCLIHKLTSSFRAPLILPSRISVQGRLSSWTTQYGVGLACVEIRSADSDELFSEHLVEVGLHLSPQLEKPTLENQSSSPIDKKQNGVRPTLLITGATGGILRPLIKWLLQKFIVVVVARNRRRLDALSNELGNPSFLQTVVFDLLTDHHLLESQFGPLIPKGNLWGIIHGASLPIIQQSLLEVPSPRLLQEWTMTGIVPIRLAEWLKKQTGAKGGRMVIIGSESTKFIPKLYSIPRHHLYGLGKRLLRETACALSQELAPHKITVNLIHPGPMPVGLNASLGSSTLRMMEAENPMKRLCQTTDLETAIAFFLDEKANYISGQELYLNGGRF